MFSFMFTTLGNGPSGKRYLASYFPFAEMTLTNNHVTFVIKINIFFDAKEKIKCAQT